MTQNTFPETMDILAEHPLGAAALLVTFFSMFLWPTMFYVFLALLGLGSYLIGKEQDRQHAEYLARRRYEESMGTHREMSLRRVFGRQS